MLVGEVVIEFARPGFLTNRDDFGRSEVDHPLMRWSFSLHPLLREMPVENLGQLLLAQPR